MRAIVPKSRWWRGRGAVMLVAHYAAGEIFVFDRSRQQDFQSHNGFRVLASWAPNDGGENRFVKIRHKLATGSQPLRQKLGCLNRAFMARGARSSSRTEEAATNAHFQIFYLRRIGAARIAVCFERLSH